MKSKTKISRMEAARLRACRREFSVSGKITRALAARRINFPRLHRLLDEYHAAIEQIGNAEEKLHRYSVEHEFTAFFRSFFAPSPETAS